jgi:hypothetical protein
MEFVNPHFLVDVAWLADNLYDPGVRVVDVTSRLTSDLKNMAKEKCFDLGHIPGSVHLDVGSGHGALSDPDHDLAWMWPSDARIEAVLGELGVTNGTRVILVARTPVRGWIQGRCGVLGLGGPCITAVWIVRSSTVESRPGKRPVMRCPPINPQSRPLVSLFPLMPHRLLLG